VSARVFKSFIDNIYGHFVDRLSNNLDGWYENSFFHESNMQLRRSCLSLGLQGEVLEFGFIDCNCLETCRVGGGPRGDGPNAERWDDNMQRSFYNGWKSIHGLKHQTLDIAHGFTIDMFGPTSLR